MWLIVFEAGDESVSLQHHSYFNPKDAGEYHNEVAAWHFDDWLLSKLLPELYLEGLIVLDNTSYHSCHIELIPFKNWEKNRCGSGFHVRG